MSQRTAAVLAFLTTVLASVLAGPTTSASAAATGQWKVSCGYVGSAADDPIASPGRPGVAHQHDFFGNSSTRAGSTYATMRGMASSCPQRDRAAYWTPSLYRNGRKVVPSGLTVSYATSVSPGESRIEPFPADFKMITGDAANTDPAAVGRHLQWACRGNTQIGRTVPRSCASGGIQARITFPSCWNGRTRTGNAARDLRFPVSGRCPAGFPRALPTLRMTVSYPTGTDVGTITLASGPVSTLHADFWNTWDQARLTALVQDCLRATRQCPHFSGVSVGAVPRTLLGTGPPLAPTRVPDAPEADNPEADNPGADAPGAPDSGDPDAGGSDGDAADGDAPDTGVPDAGTPQAGGPGDAGSEPGDAGGVDKGGVDPGGVDPGGVDPGGVDLAREPVGGRSVGEPAPSATTSPGEQATGPTGRDGAGATDGAAPRRTAVDTPTIGAPPWTRRRTQVGGDDRKSGHSGNGKQQTWTFAAEQVAPAWLGLAAAGVAVLCLIGGGLWLAQRRRTPATRTR